MKRVRAVMIWGWATAAAWGAPNPIHWSVNGVPARAVSKGGTFTVKLDAAIDSGWHLYGMEQEAGGPTALDIAVAGDTSPLSLGVVQASKPEKLMDSNFNTRVNLYVTKAEFRLPLRVSGDAQAGLQRGQVQVRYQTCNETMCLPPRTSVLDVAVTVK